MTTGWFQDGDAGGGQRLSTLGHHSWAIQGVEGELSRLCPPAGMATRTAEPSPPPARSPRGSSSRGAFKELPSESTCGWVLRTSPGRGGSPGGCGLQPCRLCSNQVALRLAYIGDEMDLHVRGLHLAQLPSLAMHR